MSALANPVFVELPPVDAEAMGGKPGEKRRLKVAGMGPGVRAEFVRILKDNAWSELDKQVERISVSRYNRLEAAIMTAQGAGKYEWNGEIHESISGTAAGFRFELLARLRIGTGDPHLDTSIVDELIEVVGVNKLQRAIAQSDGAKFPNDETPSPDKDGETKSQTNS